MLHVGSALWPSLRTVQVYGANTNVGKTIVSTLLCKTLRKRLPKEHQVRYLKPVSTGPQWEADDSHISRFTKDVSTRCLFQFSEPVSPHIAVRSSGQFLSDTEILTRIHGELDHYGRTGSGVVLVETAGGVLSPAPSGSSQADLYRPLRMPVLLVGDHRLGGIGTSISAYESLHIRGYDVNSVVLFKDEKYGNHDYLRDYFGERDIPAFALPQPPPIARSAEEDHEALANFYEEASESKAVERLVDVFESNHELRIKQLETMAERAHQSIWYPFTQHQGRSKEDILVIDSAKDDFFQTYKSSKESTSPLNEQQNPATEPSSPSNLLQPALDGSASWWTQGLGHGNPHLALTAAYAAGRYGHVMFAGAVHEPALSLAELLLRHLDNPRLQKVFYTDNGSTGMEVAVKMALRAASLRYGWDGTEDEPLIVGLKGSYHGDTIGVMDCSEPSVYNQKVEWYRGRGYWFDFPQVKVQKGRWVVQPPPGMEDTYGPTKTFSSLHDVFDLAKRNGERYERYIRDTLEDLVQNEGNKFGALVMEPIILGAGGMLFADPLFQRSLVNVVRQNPELFGASSNQASTTASSSSPSSKTWTGLPIIFDEVFTGLYRLGRFSSASLLGVHPDISVHAKLLTGGLVPLCATLASQGIFGAFLSDEKSDALLHGHSYTAHAVGCKVAEASLRAMMRMEREGLWDGFRRSWSGGASAATSRADSGTGSQAGKGVWSMWSSDFVAAVSHRRRVESVIALGSVLAISLRDEAGAGYTSTAAAGLQRKLLEQGSGEGWVVHSRVLGNVIYFMAGQTSTAQTLRAVEELLLAEL